MAGRLLRPTKGRRPVKLFLLLGLVIIASFVWFLMRNKASDAHRQVRERALEGGIGRAFAGVPARKQLGLMGRTITLGSTPERAGELVAHVATADDRVTDVCAEPGALVIEIDGSYPRVRAHLLADRTVVGVEAMSWEMGFPQGAQVWDRVATAIRTAAEHQGIAVAEGTREFAKSSEGGTRPEVWTVRVA